MLCYLLISSVQTLKHHDLDGMPEINSVFKILRPPMVIVRWTASLSLYSFLHAGIRQYPCKLLTLEGPMGSF